MNNEEKKTYFACMERSGRTRKEVAQDLLCALRMDKENTLRWLEQGFLDVDPSCWVNNGVMIVHHQSEWIARLLVCIGRNAKYINWDLYQEEGLISKSRSNVPAVYRGMYNCTQYWMARMGDGYREDIFFSLLKNAGVQQEYRIVEMLTHFLMSFVYCCDDSYLKCLVSALSLDDSLVDVMEKVFKREPLSYRFYMDQELAHKYMPDEPKRVSSYVCLDQMKSLMKNVGHLLDQDEFSYGSFTSLVNRRCMQLKGYRLIEENDSTSVWKEYVYWNAMEMLGYYRPELYRRVRLFSEMKNLDPGCFLSIPIDEKQEEELIEIVRYASVTTMDNERFHAVLRLIVLFPCNLEVKSVFSKEGE